MTSLQQKTYYDYCLHGDLPKAIRHLRKKGPQNAKDAVLLKRVIARFVKQTEHVRVASDDLLVCEVVRSYREYYREALLNLKAKTRAEVRLVKNLNEICARHNLLRSPRDINHLEITLGLAFKRRKYFALFGIVAPLRSLLIWRKQTQKRHVVPLVGGKQPVKVIFLDQFVELSWMHFATFGKRYVGGWAKEDALYCVKQSYDLKSDKFLASYLHHEAQHFSDYKSFPGLSADNLEYRAKLAELVALRRPNLKLKNIGIEARNDKSFPHNYASYRIIQDIGCIKTAKQLKERAKELLKRHSSMLRNA